MSKVAVVFWSATGNTETMANCVVGRIFMEHKVRDI